MLALIALMTHVAGMPTGGTSMTSSLNSHQYAGIHMRYPSINQALMRQPMRMNRRKLPRPEREIRTPHLYASANADSADQFSNWPAYNDEPMTFMPVLIELDHQAMTKPHFGIRYVDLSTNERSPIMFQMDPRELVASFVTAFVKLPRRPGSYVLEAVDVPFFQNSVFYRSKPFDVTEESYLDSQRYLEQIVAYDNMINDELTLGVKTPADPNEFEVFFEQRMRLLTAYLDDSSQKRDFSLNPGGAAAGAKLPDTLSRMSGFAKWAKKHSAKNSRRIQTWR